MPLTSAYALHRRPERHPRPADRRHLRHRLWNPAATAVPERSGSAHRSHGAALAPAAPTACGPSELCTLDSATCVKPTHAARTARPCPSVESRRCHRPSSRPRRRSLCVRGPATQRSTALRSSLGCSVLKGAGRGHPEGELNRDEPPLPGILTGAASDPRLPPDAAQRPNPYRLPAVYDALPG